MNGPTLSAETVCFSNGGTYHLLIARKLFWQLIEEFFKAGVRKARSEKFAKLAEEREDHVRHMEKTPSFIQFKMCTSNFCEKCEIAIKTRQERNAAWHPADVLSTLKFNDYWFPLPAFRSEATEAVALARIQEAAAATSRGSSSRPSMPPFQSSSSVAAVDASAAASAMHISALHPSGQSTSLRRSAHMSRCGSE